MPGAVLQDTFENLAQSLIALQAEYETAADRTARMEIRRKVIEAKTKARWASGRVKNEAKRAQKTEMAAWMLTWLENPPVFEAWVALRLQAMSAPPAAAASERKPTSGPSQ